MSGDLVSLQFLVVSDDAPFRALWRESARLASVPLEVLECDGTAAPAMLSNGCIDVVVVDGVIAAPERGAVLAAARGCPARPFVVAAVRGAVPIADVDIVVDRPDDLNVARMLVERCIRARVPARVLVVDDSGTMRSIVRKVLAAGRYPIKIADAPDGVAALAELRRAHADIVILDYNMPGLNGLDILREIRAVAPAAGVVMMSTTIDPSVARRALAEGATAFLNKPFYPADIDAVLDQYFGLRANGG